MVRAVIQHIQHSLTEKSQNLSQWLEASPVDEKETCLGLSTEQDIQTHLEVIGDVMQKTESETFGVCEVCQGSIESNLLEMDYTSMVCLGCLSEPERHQLETELEL